MRRLKKFAFGDYYPAGFQNTAYNYDSNKLNTINNTLGMQTPSYDTEAPQATSLNDLSDPNFQKAERQSFFNSQQGRTLGNIANMAASAIPQPENNIQTSGEQQTEAIGTSVASAIGPWWGALAKVGTTGSKYLREDDNVSHAQGFLADQLDPFHQFNSLKDGSAREKVTSFLNPVAASHFAADRRKKEAQTRERMARIERDQQSQEVLANYPIYGVGKYGLKFPNGGYLPTPTDDSEINPLASNVAEYNGSTHENGGIDLDINQDNQPEIEVENKEVIKDNMVLSNRLKPSKEFKTALKDLRFKNKGSYANIAASLGKEKGKYEKMLTSSRLGEKQTAQLMIERIDSTIDALFNDQEMRKIGSYKEKFATGGVVTDPTDPKNKKLPKDVVVAYSTTLGDNPIVKVEENDPLFYDQNQFINYYKNKTIKSFDEQTKEQYNDILKNRGAAEADAYIALKGGLPNFDSYQKLVRDYEKSQITNPTDWSKIDYIKPKVGGYRYGARGGKGLPAVGSITRTNYATGGPFSEKDLVVDGSTLVDLNNASVAQAVSSDPTVNNNPVNNINWQNYLGDITAGIGTAANQFQINRLETELNPDTISNPQYTYTSRVPYLSSTIGNQFRSATQGLNQSGVGDNAALKANLYAKNLDALNQAMDSEYQRKDAYDRSYNDLVTRTNFANTSLKNQAKQLGLENRNQRRALTQANIDNLIRSFQGNQAMRDARQLDADKTYINLLAAGNRGVDQRLMNQLPSSIKSRYGYYQPR